MGENLRMFFLDIYQKKTFIGSTNFRFSSYKWKEAPTLRKLQLPDSLAPTRRRLQPPRFSGYNRRWLQPPFLAPSNCPEI
jgi:hypothetical protein